MRFKDRTGDRRIKKRWAIWPIRCDEGEFAWCERIFIYQTCVGWSFPFGNRWETNAILPASYDKAMREGSYSHPIYLTELTVWDEPQTGA